jgi:predicted O-methyltransferase YrrM
MEPGQQPDPIYVMGQTAEERDRLIQQAGVFGQITERFLRTAGIVSGMRVLDVGCGVGDVSMLCAWLVGPGGEVIGVDRDPDVLARARERVETLGMKNLRFIEADYRELDEIEPIDAVVGRAVLMYAADPAAALRALLPHLRQGGVVAFQEFDFTTLTAMPPSDLYGQVAEWWRQVCRQAGIELQMGYKLFPAFRAAGLPNPEMQADTILGGGPDFVGYAYLGGVIRSVLPLLERFGIATAAEVDIDTLPDRLRDEIVAGGGVLPLQMIVGAAARKL